MKKLAAWLAVSIVLQAILAPGLASANHEIWPFEGCSSSGDFSSAVAAHYACDSSDVSLWVSSSEPTGTEHWIQANLTQILVPTGLEVFWASVAIAIDAGRIEVLITGNEWRVVNGTIRDTNVSGDRVTYGFEREYSAIAVRFTAISTNGDTLQIRDLTLNVSDSNADTSVSPFPNILDGAITWGLIGLVLLVAVLYVAYQVARRKA